RPGCDPLAPHAPRSGRRVWRESMKERLVESVARRSGQVTRGCAAVTICVLACLLSVAARTDGSRAPRHGLPSSGAIDSPPKPSVATFSRGAAPAGHPASLLHPLGGGDPPPGPLSDSLGLKFD